MADGMSIKVTDDISLWVAGGRITLCAEQHGTDYVEIEYDDIDTLKSKLDAAGLVAMEQRQSDPCPYDHSHTRDWCGHAGCRKS